MRSRTPKRIYSSTRTRWATHRAKLPANTRCGCPTAVWWLSNIMWRRRVDSCQRSHLPRTRTRCLDNYWSYFTMRVRLRVCGIVRVCCSLQLNCDQCMYQCTTNTYVCMKQIPVQFEVIVIVWTFRMHKWKCKYESVDARLCWNIYYSNNITHPT